MKILLAGCNIIESHVRIDRDDFSPGREMFHHCLPSDADGLYHVSKDGINFRKVEGKCLYDYPYVKINSHYDDRYEGVNDQGISLLVFETDIKGDGSELIDIGTYPSYVCIYDNKLQLVFRLINFIPKDASDITWPYLDSIIGKGIVYISGRLSNTLINPYCKSVLSYVYKSQGMELRDIDKLSKPLKSKEHVNSVRAKGGRAAAKVKSDKSIEVILRAVRSLKEEGKPYNQTLVSKICGRSRRVVNKHWPEVISLTGSRESRE